MSEPREVRPAGDAHVSHYGPRATGAAVANVLARPLLASAAHSSGLLSVPAWVDVDVAVAICGLTGIAALLPALRSARPSAAPPTASALRTERGVP